MRACSQPNPRPNGRAIRFRTDQFQLKPVVRAAIRAIDVLVPQQRRRLVHIHHQHINVAVVIEVTERAAAARVRSQYAWPALSSDVLEPAVAEIAIYEPRASMWILFEVLFDLRIDITCNGKDIRPAVVIKIRQSRSPLNITRMIEARCP